MGIRAAACFAAVTFLPSHALAQDKVACATAYENAQIERQKGHLRTSREELLICSQPSCSILQKDCVKWLNEVETALPSVVLEATGPDGQDAVDVQVTCDGTPLVSRLDGKAISMDPGLHRCRFEMGGAVREEQIVLHEGEQLRPWRISFAPEARPVEASTSLSSPEVSRARAPSSSAPAWAWVLGGAGVAAIGAGSYFELHGFSQKSELDACKGHCQQSQVDATRASFVTGDVTIGVGLVATAIAAILLLTHSRVAERATASWFRIVPPAGTAGGALEGRF